MSRLSQPLPAPAETPVQHYDLEAILKPELSLPMGRAYDQFVATAHSGHYSQTRAWARVATAGKPFRPYYFLARREGQVIGAGLLLRTCLGLLPLPVAQCERGPVSARLEVLPEVLAALRRCCLQQGILRLAVMPYWTGDDRAPAENALHQAGFSDCQRFAGRHVRSLRLDLTVLDPKKPFGTSTLAKVRQNIGRANRAGASVRSGRREDLAAFGAMQASLLAQEGRRPPPQAWYEAMSDYFLSGNGAIFVCDVEGAPISVIFITLHNGLATYAVGATSGRPLKFSKTVLPMSQAVLWAREAGAHIFDMGGIPMEGDTDPKRISIAEFKHSYSRTEVHLVREHSRWL